MSSLAMLEKITSQQGFIAALDQSGGSTPKALAIYGINASDYNTDNEMFDRVHQMRTRIVTSQAFNGDRILGAILFEDTLDRSIDGQRAADYLWQQKNVVPFLKVDKGLAPAQDGVQLMKTMPALDQLLDKALAQQVFGTKMRSLISLANEKGINALVEQQFSLAKQIISKGLVPIIEPEIDINSPQKAAAEQLLKAALLSALNKLSAQQKVMLKLTLPESDNFYRECVEHDKVIKVVALSGGYQQAQANIKVAANTGVIASFSRALTQGLSYQQSAQEFDECLDGSIERIFRASNS